MKKNNNWFYAVFILGPIIILICLLLVDKGLKTYSISFPQWLSLFIGYLTYYGTVILAYVTVHQNTVISQLTEYQLQLHEKELNADNRPWISFLSLNIYTRENPKSVYYCCCKFTPEKSQVLIPSSGNHIYRFKADKNLIIHETQIPTQIRFSIDIKNGSKTNIIDFKYNSYTYAQDNSDKILPCRFIADCIEPGMSLEMKGYQNLTETGTIDTSYSFIIDYYNEYKKEYKDNITLLIYEDKQTSNLVFDLYHDELTAHLKCIEPDDLSLSVNHLEFDKDTFHSNDRTQETVLVKNQK